MSSSLWQIHMGEDGRVRAFLERDLDWSAYALADLEPPLARHSRFWLATRDGEGRAALLVHAPPEFTVVEATGEAEGVAALLATAELPRETSIIAWLEHRRVIEARYRSEHWDLMWRMALGPGMVRLPEGGDRARRLGPADLSALQALYAARDSFAPFSAAMLESGVYYGVQHDGRLIAAAGTHVVARASRVAAIGNVYTAPAARPGVGTPHDGRRGPRAAGRRVQGDRPECQG